MPFGYLDWGTYPSVRLFANEPIEISDSSLALNVSFVYTDTIYKKIGIYDKFGNRYYTNQVSPNVWYNVLISLNNGLADILVTDKNTSQPVLDVQNVQLNLPSFQYLGVGYYDQPDYGHNWSPIRLDNVRISETVQ